jgi:D-alanyl-D-alanine carboxypeptidase
LAALAHAAMKDERFRQYVATRRHECAVTTPDGGKRTVTWSNTNKLLDVEGYEGVKTGTTTPAGNCLVACGSRGEDRLIVVVLGSTATDGRYVDARNLFRWAWRERGHKGSGGGEDEIERLVSTINDKPDMLHKHLTPSVNRLMVIGEPAIPRVLELMLDKDADTRLRAVTVIRVITMTNHGFKPGRGWLQDEDEVKWRQFWASLGNLEWNAPADDRKKSIALWKEWLKRQKQSVAK